MASRLGYRLSLVTSVILLVFATTAAAAVSDRAAFDSCEPSQGMKLRTFLWRHWRQNRSAVATNHFCILEGGGGTERFTIEPDHAGLISIRFRRDIHDPRFPHSTVVGTAYQLAWHGRMLALKDRKGKDLLYL